MKAYGYPKGEPHRPKIDPETGFLIAVFGLGFLTGAAWALVMVLSWLR